MYTLYYLLVDGGYHVESVRHCVPHSEGYVVAHQQEQPTGVAACYWCSSIYYTHISTYTYYPYYRGPTTGVCVYVVVRGVVPCISI
jgi:hypothetical protein